jgi:ATP-dependent Clp protease ATP-binding subunit ClpX
MGRQQIGFESKIKSSSEHSLREVSTEDMILFGLIPEFIGRLPVVSTLLDVTEDDLLQILQKPKNALVKQYQKLFAMEQVQLKFTESALKAVAKQAITRKSGARGLRAVLEDAMLDVMYQAPFLEGLQTCTITEDVVLKGAEPILEFSSVQLEVNA